jgi:hypothetical protein
MAKPKRDPVREDRIHNEAIVDAYGPEEQAMGWYYCTIDAKRRRVRWRSAKRSQ